MNWLDELGVKYTKIDADNMDLQTVPVTKINDTEIIGFDRPALRKALKKAGFLKWRRI